MKHLLSPDNAGVLAEMASSEALLGFDFDGTLAPIVANRDEAFMRAATARLLASAAAHYPCAVVSGRASVDVRARLGSAKIRFVVGNHGLEPHPEMVTFERDTALAAPRLEAALGTTRGIDLEDKRYSIAVHYRRSRSKREAVGAIRAAVASLPVAMHVVAGKCVLNVVSDGAPNKGDAIVRLRDEVGARVALFVGDDVTDEDVFVRDEPGRLVTVRVGPSRRSAARYHLRDQREIDLLLRELIRLRASAEVSAAVRARGR